MLQQTDFASLFGCSAASKEFSDHLRTTFSIESLPAPKTYADIAYISLPDQGISYLFEPLSGYRMKYGQTLDQLKLERLIFVSVDIYNTSPFSKPKNQVSTRLYFEQCPKLPLTLDTSPNKSTSTNFQLTTETTGKELVDALGEPERKGQGNEGLWIEWTNAGFHFEFSTAKGAEAWDDLQKCVWTRVNIFQIGEVKGTDEDDVVAY